MKTHPGTERPRNLLAPFPQRVAIRQPGRPGGAARDEDKEMSEKKTRILIIDDDPEIVSYLTDIFQDAGYETLSAGNGVEGIEVAQTRKPDLITLDMDMPGRPEQKRSGHSKAHHAGSRAGDREKNAGEIVASPGCEPIRRACFPALPNVAGMPPLGACPTRRRLDAMPRTSHRPELRLPTDA
jgi:hypothetical protein